MTVLEQFPPYERRLHISPFTFEVLTACLAVPAVRPVQHVWIWQHIFDEFGEFGLRHSPLKLQIFYMARAEARRMGLEHSRDVNARLWWVVFEHCRKAKILRDNCSFWMQRNVSEAIKRRAPRDILMSLAETENEKNQGCFSSWEIEDMVTGLVQDWLAKRVQAWRYAA